MALVARYGFRRGTDAQELLLKREWLVTNGLGGYASGTLAGVATRRYHGLLIAALPNPVGRTMMLNGLSEQLQLTDGRVFALGAHERGSALDLRGADLLREFRMEDGLPHWIYEFEGYVIQRSLFLTHLHNTVHVVYRMLAGAGPLRISLRPLLHFRFHDANVSQALEAPYIVTIRGERVEVASAAALPSLKFKVEGDDARFTHEHLRHDDLRFRAEQERGYDAVGQVWSDGHFKATLGREGVIALVASTEEWSTLGAIPSALALEYERTRRARLVQQSGVDERDTVATELVLAADQFLISPAGRYADAVRAKAQGQELRTVIAGYHWFTDWGRDTMISLEGLTLSTGRVDEARWILLTFAHYVRDGLIPNMFPEGAQDGLYHTADATLWFFHAVDRYHRCTRDDATLRLLLPTLEQIVAKHIQGTHFGIGVDPSDGLLMQGAEGYQLTWMDAKCGDWVVTPRRGKAVEINALWYNALCVVAEHAERENRQATAETYKALALRVQQSFNELFWYEQGGYLYDVISKDGAEKDSAFRPNQVFAISLSHPVLARERWQTVLNKVAKRLVTPVGLRSLSREHPDYKSAYRGDLRTRDAAYHQGTVWSWLIGPFVDAWLRSNPGDALSARRFLHGLVSHLGEAAIGQVSEVFDADEPYEPGGCIAQAWGVAELLRAWRATSGS